MSNDNIYKSEAQLFNRLQEIVVIATKAIKEVDIKDYKQLINCNDREFCERFLSACVCTSMRLKRKGEFDESEELDLLYDELDDIIYDGEDIGIREELENHMTITFKSTLASGEGNRTSASNAMDLLSTIVGQAGRVLYSTAKEVGAASKVIINSIKENKGQGYNDKENVYTNEYEDIREKDNDLKFEKSSETNYQLDKEEVKAKTSEEYIIQESYDEFSEVDIDLEIDEIALNNSSFLRFVELFSELGGGALIRNLQNKYSYLKNVYGDNESVCLGCNGGIEFAGAILLCIHYEVRNDNSIYEECIKSIMYAFKGASPIMFSDSMDDVINRRSDMEYEEWSKVYRFLIYKHGEEIRELEFCEDYTDQAHLRLKEFLNY